MIRVLAVTSAGALNIAIAAFIAIAACYNDADINLEPWTWLAVPGLLSLLLLLVLLLLLLLLPRHTCLALTIASATSPITIPVHISFVATMATVHHVQYYVLLPLDSNS
jgi:hypothetical protein